MNKEKLIYNIKELVKPIIENKGYTLYYIEFKKESGENYLRLYIDNEEGIVLEDCEIVSRAVSDVLDEVDPIPYSYYLEVSSSGINRILHNDDHLSMYVGQDIDIKLKELFKGTRNLDGILKDFNKEEIIINKEESIMSVPREYISVIRLKGDL